MGSNPKGSRSLSPRRRGSRFRPSSQLLRRPICSTLVPHHLLRSRQRRLQFQDRGMHLVEVVVAAAAVGAPPSTPLEVSSSRQLLRPLPPRLRSLLSRPTLTACQPSSSLLSHPPQCLSSHRQHSMPTLTICPNPLPPSKGSRRTLIRCPSSRSSRSRSSRRRSMPTLTVCQRSRRLSLRLPSLRCKCSSNNRSKMASRTSVLSSRRRCRRSPK